MWLIDQIVEQRMKEAQRTGEFDDLPGKGKPLTLDDDSMIPEELRVGYRILKNHGAVPPELERYREIQHLEQLIEQIRHDEVADVADRNEGILRKRLRLLQLQNQFEQERRKGRHLK